VQPDSGASWIISGTRAASATRAKCSSMPFSSARSVAPWYGGMSMIIAAPADAALRARAAATRVLKWLHVTITGTRPATCARHSSVRWSRSSSVSRNCSE
jgi:hypothetical protein